MYVKNEKGQALVIFAVALVGLLAFISLAVDAGKLYVERRNAQSAADSAAFAAAVSKIKNEDSAASQAALLTTITTAANQVAQTDGFANSTVTVNYPPKRLGRDNTTYPTCSLTPPNYGGDPTKPDDCNPDYVQVIIKSQVKTSFLQLFGRNMIENTSESVVLATGHGSFLGKDLIWSTNTTKCDSSNVYGNAQIHLIDGSWYTRSSATEKPNNCDAFGVNGSPNYILVDNGSLDVVGHMDSSLNSNASATYVDVKNYPIVPMPDCNYYYSSKSTVSGNTINPGWYDGISISSSSTITFNPGLYCFTDDVKITGSSLVQVGTATDPLNSSNHGVLFVFWNSNTNKGPVFDLAGNGSNSVDKVTLTAPNSPYCLKKVGTTASSADCAKIGKTGIDYAGMLFYANPANYDPSVNMTKNNTFWFNGNGATNLDGAIYAPTTNCNINGNSAGTAVHTQMLCNTANFGGGSNITLQLDTANEFKFGGYVNLAQ